MKLVLSSVSLVFRNCILIAILLCLSQSLLAKRKDDVVVMQNGDTFTGEIKRLQHGELSLNLTT
jgi:hypothetical protein